ncbi:MAG: hypothetical protein V4772_24135, partial [Pseudomonadota bacterium]
GVIPASAQQRFTSSSTCPASALRFPCFAVGTATLARMPWLSAMLMAIFVPPISTQATGEAGQVMAGSVLFGVSEESGAIEFFQLFLFSAILAKTGIQSFFLQSTALI